jgi:hypothetical protein
MPHQENRFELQRLGWSNFPSVALVAPAVHQIAPCSTRSTSEACVVYNRRSHTYLTYAGTILRVMNHNSSVSYH